MIIIVITTMIMIIISMLTIIVTEGFLKMQLKYYRNFLIRLAFSYEAEGIGRK